MRTSIAIIATHPIQYQVPWFRALARHPRIRLKVYFALLPDANQQGVGFGVPFSWDIPMLEGYEWATLPNSVRSPSLQSFFSSSTPTVGMTLAKDRPDVVVLTGWHALPLLQALHACTLLGIPRIARGESNALLRRRWWVRIAHRAFLRRYDAFLAIGKSNRAFYLGNRVESSRIFDARYFIDNERFAEGHGEALRARPALRERWGIAPDAFCFLYVGKLEPKKRIFDLLEAAARASTFSGDLHLLVVGSGELLEESRARAARTGMKVSFAGFLNQTELPQAYAAGDCLVLPSDYGETWGLVVNEAMACGLPAIVSDRVGCGEDLVEPGITGSLFSFGNTEELAQRMFDMARNPPAARMLGKAAQDRIAGYSIEAAVAGTLKAADFVLNGCA